MGSFKKEIKFLIKNFRNILTLIIDTKIIKKSLTIKLTNMISMAIFFLK